MSSRVLNASAARARGETITAPAHLQERPILKQKIWKRLHVEDKNWMAIVCGQTGEGKSEFGLRLCELLDPNFSADNIVFTIQGFMREVNRNAPEGSFILFDEVGVALSYATHYDTDQIELNHVLETWREQNRGLVMTSPHINFVQKGSRGLLHAQMDMQNINYGAWLASARYRYFQTNPDSGDIYKKHPRLRDANGVRKQMKQLRLYRPTPELIEPYLEKKRAFNDELNEGFLADLEEAEAEQEREERGPKDVADTILDENRLTDVVSLHGGHNKAQLDHGLIQMEFDTTVRGAKNVKKLLDGMLAQEELEGALNV